MLPGLKDALAMRGAFEQDQALRLRSTDELRASDGPGTARSQVTNRREHVDGLAHFVVEARRLLARRSEFNGRARVEDEHVKGRVRSLVLPAPSCDAWSNRRGR